MTYQESLLQPQWDHLRERLARERSYNCDDCGEHHPPRRGKTALQPHHCWYEYGKLAWEYPDDCFLMLCPRCHPIRQKVQNSALVVLGKLTRLMTVPEVECLVFELVSNRAELERDLEVTL